MLLCPVCHEPLVDDERGAACAGGHRFDRAREGYLYLLRSSKSGDSMGDPKSQARSRRDFLNRGYYAPLRDAMVELVRERVSGRAASTNCPMTLLDICSVSYTHLDVYKRQRISLEPALLWLPMVPFAAQTVGLSGPHSLYNKTYLCRL